MKVLALDIQGFELAADCSPHPSSDSSPLRFFAKELAITNGTQTSHYVFELPRKYSSLSVRDKRQVNYVTHNIHGLQYSTGFVNYDRINDIIRQEIIYAAVDIVYLRGRQKKNFLEEAFLEINLRPCPKIVNIETLNNWDGPPKLECSIPVCMSHLTDKPFMCSLRNCKIIHEWICNYLPK